MNVNDIISDNSTQYQLKEYVSSDQIFPKYDNAGAHNSIYRGKDLTSYFNSGEMSIAIANGSFEDIYPGDYIIKSVTIDGTTYSDVKWIVGDLDYYYHRGGFDLQTHHILIFPETFFGLARMNPTITTEGGYVASEMWTETIPKYVTSIQDAFGTSHVLKHSELLTNSVNLESESATRSIYIGATDNWNWTNVLVNIFNEVMIYGTTSVGSSLFDVGDCSTQIAAIRHNKSLSFCRGWYWLRTVSYSGYFAHANTSGNASYTTASRSEGRVRPYFLLT